MRDDNVEVQPFRIAIDAAVVDDLRMRLGRTRWPELEVVDDWSQGVPVAYLREFCRYWADEYDWTAREALLNRLPQFCTLIDGLRLHFIHARSPHADARPLIITHGWPGSILEFGDAIEGLTDPTSTGGRTSDAFHVVCPSLPGFGFSERPSATGWGVARIASAWNELMCRLGYDRYFAQGGDWGAVITTLIGARYPKHCAGIHLNMPLIVPRRRSSMTDAESKMLEDWEWSRKWGTGYSALQSTRPQTLAYGLADSPAGQAAWVIEKFQQWTDNDGVPEDAVTRDRLIDNLMLYWATNTGGSSARLYWESYGEMPGELPQVPVGCSIFPAETMRTSEAWARAHYGDRLVYFNTLDRGGHFPALEEPDLFVEELRACFRGMRSPDN